MHDNVAFTTDIEEKLEVAQVQVEVYRAIYEDVELREPKKSELLGIIDEQLLDISTVRRCYRRDVCADPWLER